jgi:hypothetical protein
MKPQEMASQCAASINFTVGYGGKAKEASVTFVTPKGWKPPPKFPRGRLCIVKENGERVWHFNAFNVLAWMVANDLAVIPPEVKS